MNKIWVVFTIYTQDYVGDDRLNRMAFATENEASDYACKMEEQEEHRNTTWGWEGLDFVESADSAANSQEPEACEQCEGQLMALTEHEGQWICLSCKNDDLK